MAAPGLWNVWWCLYSLVTGTGLKYLAQTHGDGGLLALPPWSATRDADTPGGAVWWMTLILGLIWVSMPVVGVLARRQQLQQRIQQEAHQAPPLPPDDQWRLQARYAAAVLYGKRLAGICFGAGVVISLALMGWWMSLSVEGPGAPNAPLGWAMGVLFGCGVTALVLSFVLPRCPACGRRLSQFHTEDTCPGCGVRLR